MDMSLGNKLSTSLRARIFMPELKGSVVCVQSSDQVARKPSGVHLLQPSMNLSSVAAWISAAAGMARDQMILNKIEWLQCKAANAEVSPFFNLSRDTTKF